MFNNLLRRLTIKIGHNTRRTEKAQAEQQKFFWAEMILQQRR